MPDLLTHVLFGISLGLVLVGDGDRKRILLVTVGSILSDIDRPIGWLFEFFGVRIIGLTESFHSLLGAVLLTFAASCLFIDSELDRVEIFKLLFIGEISHILLDMTMFPWAEMGIFLLYPLRIPFSFHLFWSDYWYYPLFGFAALGVALAIHLVRTRYLRIMKS